MTSAVSVTDEDDEMVPLKVAVEMGVPYTTLRDLIKSGKLKAETRDIAKRGDGNNGKYRVRRGDIKDLLRWRNKSDGTPSLFSDDTHLSDETAQKKRESLR